MTIIDIRIGGRGCKVDLDRLSPKARAMAEAIDAHPAKVAGDIWMEADTPIRNTTPGWEMWFTAEEAGEPERRPWRGWSTVPLADGDDPHERLEIEAAKVPPGWHVLGAHPHRPVPSSAEAAAVREAAGRDRVVAYLAGHGRPITAAGWSSYVGKRQAPRPVRHVGRTPIWSLDDVDRWLEVGTGGDWQGATA